MGEQENKTLVEQFDKAVFNGHDLSAGEAMIADDAVEHDPMPGLSNDKKGSSRRCNSCSRHSRT